MFFFLLDSHLAKLVLFFSVMYFSILPCSMSHSCLRLSVKAGSNSEINKIKSSPCAHAQKHPGLWRRSKVRAACAAAVVSRQPL